MNASDVESIVGLLAVVALLAQLARRRSVPYPIAAAGTAGTLAVHALLLAAARPGRRAELARRTGLVLGRCGMRGGVSLAAALAVPATAAGHPFPARDEIVFFAYALVLATLVVPGLTLGRLLGRLGFASAEERARGDARARA